jgi:hypothetical protein
MAGGVDVWVWVSRTGDRGFEVEVVQGAWVGLVEDGTGGILWGRMSKDEGLEETWVW